MAVHDAEPLPDAPYSLDLLADLHAGVLTESVSDRLWPLVQRDPRAMTVIAALDHVSARLGDIGTDSAAGEPMPPDVAERIDRALEAAGHDVVVVPVADLARRRGRRTIIFSSVAATIALAIAVTTAVVVYSGSDSSTDMVADAPATGPAAPTLILDSDQVDASLAYSIMADSRDAPLLRSGTLRSCLAANGFEQDAVVLGGTPIELDGREGIMLVLPHTASRSGLTLLAVAPECGVDNPATLLRRDLD